MKPYLATALLFALLLSGCAGPGTTQVPAPEEEAPLSSRQTVAYEEVTLQKYPDGESAHPYVHSVITNHSDKTIVGSSYAMVAFDEEGAPLKIDWNCFDSSSGPTYAYLCDWGSREIAPGETYDEDGGWSLNFFGTDEAVNQIAYVLYCDKEISFDDGTLWQNPGYEAWRSAYEGKPVPVEELESYYPYIQELMD